MFGFLLFSISEVLKLGVKLVFIDCLFIVVSVVSVIGLIFVFILDIFSIMGYFLFVFIF